ncbi:MAG: hypothetical protein JWR21_3465 [Herminiimonas sp.]|nr:hypothetical protein [Herminiimonas sp.]
MGDLKVGKTCRVQAASTACSAREMDGILELSCSGFPARMRDAVCPVESIGLPPGVRLANRDGREGNAADAANAMNATHATHAASMASAAWQLHDVRRFQRPTRQGRRPPSVHDNIRQQCEAFLRDFSGDQTSSKLHDQAAGDTGMHDSGSGSGPIAVISPGAVQSGELNQERMRAALRTLVLAPGHGTEAASAQLQAFCRFLQSLAEERPGARPSYIRLFCGSASIASTRAIEFARNHFDGLKSIPEVAAHTGGDVVFLLLGCLAGKGIDEIWSREAMRALPIAHLAHLNALASAAANRPEAVKRVA